MLAMYSTGLAVSGTTPQLLAFRRGQRQGPLARLYQMGLPVPTVPCVPAPPVRRPWPAFSARVATFFHSRQVGQCQLGIDGLDILARIDPSGHMNHVVVRETAHHLGDGIGLGGYGPEIDYPIPRP